MPVKGDDPTEEIGDECEVADLRSTLANEPEPFSMKK